MTAEEARHDIVTFIEIFYNSERLNSYTEYYSPNDYEKMQKTLVCVSVFI